MKLIPPSKVTKALRARIARLPRSMRTGQHGGFPDQYPMLWVVVEGADIAAYATAYETEPGVLSLRGCQVARKYRGRGLQSRLLRVRISHARRRGYRMVRTYCADDNWPSICNVLRAGFKPIRVSDGWLTLERTL